MNLTVQVQLLPSAEQAAALLETMERFNAACDFMAGHAFALRTANRVKIQNAAYHEARSRFTLPSRLTTLAIDKTRGAYKRDLNKLVHFHQHGAITFDAHCLRWRDDAVSLLTLGGRAQVPFVMGEHQRQFIGSLRGQTKLSYIAGRFYLLANAKIPEPKAYEPTGFLGVDLGLKNIAADSDGAAYLGAHLASLRTRYARLRGKLQRKGTKSARRLLKRRRSKEGLFARDVNHRIAKEIVRTAKGTTRGIALENLKGIRERTTVRQPQRRAHSSWAFHQLRAFIEYKAALAGVPVVAVEPRNTSRECPECGHIAKNNRPTRDSFHCQSCGFAAPADFSAARVIASRAAAVQPYAPSLAG